MFDVGNGSIRRSYRRKVIDLNGRGYLSDQLGLSIEQLEAWTQSSGVKAALATWHRRCIEDAPTYNSILNMINAGVFETRNNKFEEELLLASIGEYSLYEDEKTIESFAMDMWAEATRSIVKGSLDFLHIFSHLYRYHTARLFAIVIDMLCLAFHSIAHRENDSCWYIIIRGHSLTDCDRSTTTEGAHTPSVASSADVDSAIGGMEMGESPPMDKIGAEGPYCEIKEQDQITEDDYQYQTEVELSSDED